MRPDTREGAVCVALASEALLINEGVGERGDGVGLGICFGRVPTAVVAALSTESCRTTGWTAGDIIKRLVGFCFSFLWWWYWWWYWWRSVMVATVRRR